MKKTLVLVMLVVAMIAIAAFGFMACNKSTYTIGVQKGTTGEYYVKGDSDWGYSGFSNVAYSAFDNGGMAVQALKNGSVNAVIIDEGPAKALAESVEGIKVIDVVLTTEKYGIGVDKNQDTLKNQINAIFATYEFETFKATVFANYFDNENYEPTPIVAATTADSSKAAQQLVVATNAEFPPFEYKEGTGFVGIDMEIAAFIANKLNLELVIIDMDFDSVVTSVGVNNIDIALSGLTINEKRKESVNFTDSYYEEAAQVLIVLESDTTFDGLTTVEQIEAKLKSL